MNDLIPILCYVIGILTGAFFAYVVGFANGRSAGRMDGEIELLRERELHLRQMANLAVIYQHPGKVNHGREASVLVSGADRREA